MNVKIIGDPQEVEDGLMFEIEFSEGENKIYREYHYVFKNKSIHLQNKNEKIILDGKDITISGGSIARTVIDDYLRKS